MDIGKNSVAHKHLLYSKKLLHSRNKVGCRHFTMFGVMLIVTCIRWVGVGFLRSAWCDMYDGRPSLHDDRKVKRATARVAPTIYVFCSLSPVRALCPTITQNRSIFYVHSAIYLLAAFI